MQQIAYARDFVGMLPGFVQMKAGDYIGEDGLIHCGKCHEAREQILDFPLNPAGMPPFRKFPQDCDCERQARAEGVALQKDAERRKRAEEIRKEGITDARYKNATFANDDRANPAISDACIRSVEKWPEMYQRNMGIMLYGDVGTGKTFLASCIANALAEKGVRLRMTTLPELSSAMSANYGKERIDILDRVKHYDLLILDDVGMSRNTDTSMENAFAVINARNLVCKPLIVTTNLTPADMKEEKNIQLKRIYSRIFHMTKNGTIYVPGEDRRFK